jgi:hypothetical protein
LLWAFDRQSHDNSCSFCFSQVISIIFVTKLFFTIIFIIRQIMNIVWHQYRQINKKHETELQNRKVIIMSVDFALNETIIKEYVHIFWSWLRQKRYIWTRDCVLLEAHRQRQYSYVIRFLNAAIEFCAVVTEEKKTEQDSGWSSWSELNWITMQFQQWSRREWSILYI